MNIGQHPELLDRLAAAYALGTLKGAARKRLETYARQSATVRASLLLWQGRMQAMNELPEGVAPSAALWPRIERALREEMMWAGRRVESESHAFIEQLRALRSRLNWWRGGAWIGAAATVAAITVGVRAYQQADTENALLQTSLQAQLASVPQLGYVAVLADDQASASILVTIDRRNNRLTVQRVSGFTEDERKSLQLWALPAGGKPASLGVLGSERVMRLDALGAVVQQAALLAVSLEPKGGVPSETGPTGPVLFKGSLLPATL